MFREAIAQGRVGLERPRPEQEEGRQVSSSRSCPLGRRRFDGDHSSQHSVGRARETFKQSSVDKGVAQELIVDLVGFER